MFSLKSFQIICVIIVLTTAARLNVNAAATKKQDPKCLLPMEPGPCRMSLDRFYYNSNTDSCEEFKFGGCRGNDNKFGFKQTCEEACKLSTTSTSTSTSTSTTSSSLPTSTEKVELTKKQLKISTLKSLTSTAPVTEKNKKSTTVTTSKPQVTVH